jgi:RNAse (barnase) inhibitor barstar
MLEVTDWESFHDTFAAALGFPDFYGRNLNAWDDCLTHVDLDDGLTNVVVEPGEVLTLQLDECNEFRVRCPEIYAALIEHIAFVNWSRIQQGDRAILALAFH